MNDLAKLDTLHEHNYREWYVAMVSFLKSQHLWQVVEAEVPACPSAAWKKRNAEAFSIIALCVDDKNLKVVRHSKTAQEAWNALKEEHLRNSAVNPQKLIRRLAHRKCGVETNLDNYLQKFVETAWELEMSGLELPNDILVAMLLNGLPRAFWYFVILIENRTEVPSLASLVQEVKEERDRQVRMKLEPSGKCENCGKFGHLTRDCRYLICYVL